MSVVTIKGEECRVMELGQVADATGGEVSFILSVMYYSTIHAVLCISR